MNILTKALIAVALLGQIAMPGVASAQWFGRSPQLKTGEDIYRHVCQACHMPDGRGAKSPVVTAPALANNPLLGDAGYPISVVLGGKAAMPWFNGSLTDAQISVVIGYIRTHFGNNFPEPVTEEDVRQLAPPVPSREP